jgi:hypothetical protein
VGGNGRIVDPDQWDMNHGRRLPGHIPRIRPLDHHAQGMHDDRGFRDLNDQDIGFLQLPGKEPVGVETKIVSIQGGLVFPAIDDRA